MGFGIGGTSLDERRRVDIPKGLKQKLSLKPNQSLLIKARGDEIALKPALEAEKFIEELGGCVRGSEVKPDRSKGDPRIWPARPLSIG